MKTTSFVYLLAAGSFLSCDGTITAPPTSEDLAVSVVHRNPIQGEQLPTVRILGGQNSVSVQVSRPGMCATLVEAGVSREPRELAVVARVSSNPAALCALIVSVVDYAGTITAVPGGTYRVRVFEGVGDNTPQLIGSATVAVTGLAPF